MSSKHFPVWGCQWQFLCPWTTLLALRSCVHQMWGYLAVWLWWDLILSCCAQCVCVCLHGFVHWFLTRLGGWMWLEHHGEVLQFICELHPLCYRCRLGSGRFQACELVYVAGTVLIIQLWAHLVFGWVTIWDTLVAAKDVIDNCHVLLWLMSYGEYKRFPECFPTHKKARSVCCHVYVSGAHKRTCEVHQNMPSHHTSICHEWVCKWVLHWKAEWKRGIASYEMAHLYAPQGGDLGGGGFPSRIKWNDTVWKVA